MNRRQVLKMAGGSAVLFVAAATGFPALAAKDKVYTGLVSGVAVGGYDAVAYFTEKKPVRGSKDITAKHAGVTWRFASAANRDAFVANPGRYAPQYGGYCAWAVASGYTAATDPEAWEIFEGKLYLNFSKGVQRMWSEDIPGNISKAEGNWPTVEPTPASMNSANFDQNPIPYEPVLAKDVAESLDFVRIAPVGG